MKKILSVFIVLSISFLSAVGCAQKDTGSDVYIVKNVVDGDTLELAGGEKVRYVGIDTPETMRRSGKEWVFDPEDYAVSAKDMNKDLVSGGRVRLEFDIERKDRYGRLLAYVYNEDGKMVNKELVVNGLAMVYTFRPNVKHMNELLKAQEDAKQNKRGLWGTIRTISPGEAAQNIGSFRIVRGKVKGVYARGNKVILVMEGGMTAVIYRGNLEFFDINGIDPASYASKEVEITGKIEDRNGPRIIIDNPSQIRLIEGV